MAIIGCLGDIPFEVSANTVHTLTDIKWSGSSKYGTHLRHTGDTLTEFQGNAPDKFSFKMILSAFLGVNPLKSVEKIIKYKNEGRTLALVIGNKTYGKYRWSILSYDVQMRTFDVDGNVLSITLSIALQEYLRL